MGRGPQGPPTRSQGLMGPNGRWDTSAGAPRGANLDEHLGIRVSFSFSLLLVLLQCGLWPLASGLWPTTASASLGGTREEKTIWISHLDFCFDFAEILADIWIFASGGA